MGDNIVSEKVIMKTDKILTGNSLKTIALLSMLIDHIGCLIIYPLYIDACWVDGVHMLGNTVPDKAKHIYLIYMFLRTIGRLAFPIYAFMLVEGFLHAKDLKKYCGRLLVFAVISEVPYDIANSHTLFNPTSQNVLWTFVIAIIMLWCLQKDNIRRKTGKTILIISIAMVFSVLSVGGIGGILLIASMYLFKNNKKKYLIACIVSTVILAFQFMWIQLFSLLAIFLLEQYNGARGRGCKWIFYVFYPAHFLILTFLTSIIIR